MLNSSGMNGTSYGYYVYLFPQSLYDHLISKIRGYPFDVMDFDIVN